MPALAHDLGKVEGLMDIFSKGRNSNSMLKRSNPERNDVHEMFSILFNHHHSHHKKINQNYESSEKIKVHFQIRTIKF